MTNFEPIRRSNLKPERDNRDGTRSRRKKDISVHRKNARRRKFSAR